MEIKVYIYLEIETAHPVSADVLISKEEVLA